MSENRQTIVVTVDSETPSPLTADRIQKMLRDRFSHCKVKASSLNEDQGLDARLNGAVEGMKENLVVLVDILSHEAKEMTEIFAEETLQLMNRITKLGVMVNIREQVADFIKSIHPHQSPIDQMRVATPGGLREMDDTVIDRLPDEAVHDMMHFVGKSKKLETPCDGTPSEQREWLKKNIKPNPKEMS
jgi:hypothetical protein